MDMDRYRWVIGEVLEPRHPESWHRRAGVRRRIVSLSEALRRERGATLGKPYLDDQLTLAAYMAYFAPWNLLRLHAVLGLHGFQLPGALARPGSQVLDLGAGPLVFSHYLALRHPQLLEVPTVVHAVDHSSAALELGQEVLARLAPGHRWEIRPVSMGLEQLLGQGLDVEQISLVVELFCLNEYARGRQRRQRLLPLVSALQRLPARAEVLCLEPGNREAGRLLPALRQELLAAGGVEVKGPCTHHETCPLLRTRDRSWCHFRRQVRNAPDWLLEVSTAVGLARQRLFFSYLWWRRARGERRGRESTAARILGEPMALGRDEEGVYACAAPGRVLLSWRRGERPPPGRIRQGRILRRLPRKVLRQDRRTHAPVYAFPATRLATPDTGGGGRRPRRRRGPSRG